jgi:plasmid stabilization system protein ParE
MRFRFHPEARAEFGAAALRYADESPALALRFIDAVYDAVRRIVDSPPSGRIVELDVRRRLTKVFPFGVLYAVESEMIVIVAIAHCSREPGYWRARLGPPTGHNL